MACPPSSRESPDLYAWTSPEVEPVAPVRVKPPSVTSHPPLDVTHAHQSTSCSSSRHSDVVCRTCIRSGSAAWESNAAARPELCVAVGQLGYALQPAR